MALYTVDTFTPERSLGYLSRRVSQLNQALLEPIFADEGLTHTQWSALISIRLGRAATCADLARDLGHDRGAMTRLVDLLEERGWIRRERNRDDRRVVDLTLTPSGLTVSERCRERAMTAWNAWMAQWSEGRAGMLIEGMQQLLATLDTLDREHAA